MAFQNSFERNSAAMFVTLVDILKSNLNLFRFEGTLKIIVILHSYCVYSSAQYHFALVQQPQSQPVIYTEIVLSEPYLQFMYVPEKEAT